MIQVDSECENRSLTFFPHLRCSWQNTTSTIFLWQNWISPYYSTLIILHMPKALILTSYHNIPTKIVYKMFIGVKKWSKKWFEFHGIPSQMQAIMSIYSNSHMSHSNTNITFSVFKPCHKDIADGVLSIRKIYEIKLCRRGLWNNDAQCVLSIRRQTLKSFRAINFLCLENLFKI